MASIAGHTFTESPTGRRCMVHNSTGALCYRSWISIKDTCRTDVGKYEIAHSGSLTENEYMDIERERVREIEAVWETVSFAASSGSR